MFLVLSLLILAINADRAVLQRYWIDNPLAICNDGSRGVYYYADALDPAFDNKFLIYLVGGSQCYDKQSCAQRFASTPSLMSSSYSTPTTTWDGIFDTDPTLSPFWGFKKVAILYCSSDGYMGNAPASSTTWGWHFRGQELVRGVIEILKVRNGMTSNSTIYLAGGSAGGRGVMANLDDLADNHFPLGAEVVGIMDSPLWVDLKPFSSNFPGFQYQEKQKVLYYNTSRIIPKDCAKKYSQDLWKCQFGQYRIPYLKTPFFMIASQYDQFQLSADIQSSPPFGLEAVAYANQFAHVTRQVISGFAKQLTPKHAIFSWACYNHDVSRTPLFYAAKGIDKVSQNDALSMFILDESNRLWMDSCGGFSCGSGCQ
eukprot:TRINITY_DN15614_c0_g4_i1.p1 TRINITY_DN15614_c0_g4~~TRINITY_DN15614_c0_g4_i1.p1  ORF type:complete len:401 (+),score=54.63 TRINITY_DN15614_c0_g4_i1:95-1204(+)